MSDEDFSGSVGIAGPLKLGQGSASIRLTTDGASLLVNGVPSGAITKTITTTGAVNGQDATAAFTNSLAGCVSGDVLYVPPGNWHITPPSNGGGIVVPDGVRIVGAGRKASILTCDYAGADRVKVFAPAGDVGFYDLGFQHGTVPNRLAQIEVIFGNATCTSIRVERCNFIGGFMMSISTWQDVTTDVMLSDFLIDGQLAGLAGTGDRQVVMGVSHNGNGYFRIINGKFTGLGSNAVDGPPPGAIASHCVYVSPVTTLLMSKCVFSNHIQGRYVQFYNGGTITVQALSPNVIRDCDFGAYNAIVNPYTMTECSESNFTTYDRCHWANQTCTTVAVNVKGVAAFPGCRFDGASFTALDYLGNPDSFGGSSYDPFGAYFNGFRNGQNLAHVKAMVYSASITPHQTDGEIYPITATNGTAFTINAIYQPRLGAIITFDILNSSGGALGTITWDAVYKLAGSFTNPANTKHRLISFYYNGTNWIETFRSAADI